MANTFMMVDISTNKYHVVLVNVDKNRRMEIEGEGIFTDLSTYILNLIIRYNVKEVHINRESVGVAVGDYIKEELGEKVSVYLLTRVRV